MRVAFLTNFIAPYRLPLLEALRDRVGELRVFLSTAMERDRPWDADWGGLDVIVQRNLSLYRPYRDPMGFSRKLSIHVPYDTIPRLFRYAPDVVISSEMGARTLQALAYKILRPKTGFVVWGTLSEHSEREWGQIRQGLRRIILRYADAVLVNGRSGARYVKQFGVRAERIFIVNQPVDVEAFRNSAIRPDADMIRLLFVGTLTRRKGLHLFIENLAEWSLSHQGRKIHIDWVGEGDLAPILQRYQYGPDISQTFHGALPYVAMPEVFAKADILIFPSLLDEWGLVVNEAMASGLPIVGSIFSEAVEELVTDDETGWTFDPTSAKSTLHALNRALTAPRDQLARMSRAAERRIETLTPSNAAEIIATAAKQARACGTVPMP